MPRLPDLVRDSELPKTTVHGKVTRHLFALPGKSSRQRKIWQEQRWQQVSFLGKGSYGDVWKEDLVQGGEGCRTRAVKVIRRTSRESASVDYVRELEAVAKFSQEKYRTCFVQSYGWFQSEHAIHIAMEFFEHGDLQSHLSNISQTLPEHQVREITFQLLEGLQFMHDNGFVHRDLKPSNILIRYPGPDWWVKIGDFGISKRAIEGLTACRTFTGTLGFLAPEILARQGLIDTDVYSGMKGYTSAVDIWSLGEIMYRCLTGSSTFASPAKIARFTNGSLPLPLDKLRSEWEITDEGCQFLERVLEIQPKHRMSASEALGHPWLVSLSEVSPRSSEEITGDASETEENDLSNSLDNLSIASSEGSARWSTIDQGYAEQKLPHKDATATTLKADMDRPDELKAKNIQSSTKTVRLQKSTINAPPRNVPVEDEKTLVPDTTGPDRSESRNSRGTVVTRVPEIRVQESPTGLQAGESQRPQREHRQSKPESRRAYVESEPESSEDSLGPSPPEGASRTTRIPPPLFPWGEWSGTGNSSKRSQSPKTKRAKASDLKSRQSSRALEVEVPPLSRSAKPSPFMRWVSGSAPSKGKKKKSSTRTRSPKPDPTRVSPPTPYTGSTHDRPLRRSDALPPARRYLYDEIPSVGSPRSEDSGGSNSRRTVLREPRRRTRSPSPLSRPPMGAKAPNYYYPTPAGSVRPEMPTPTYHGVEDEDPWSHIDFRSQKARRVRAESVSSTESLYANVGYSTRKLYGEESGPEDIRWSRARERDEEGYVRPNSSRHSESRGRDESPHLVNYSRRIGPEDIRWSRSAGRDKDGQEKPSLSRHATYVY